MSIKQIDSKEVLFERNNYLFCKNGQAYEKITKNDTEDIYVIKGLNSYYKKLTTAESKKQFEVFVSGFKCL